jgi:hypothetical protein
VGDYFSPPPFLTQNPLLYVSLALPFSSPPFFTAYGVFQSTSFFLCPSLTFSFPAALIALGQVRNGHIKRITDSDIQSLVIEIMGANVSTTYITCPADPKETLGIKLPFLVMIVKNMKKYFTFEVQVRFSAGQSVAPCLTSPQRAPNLPLPFPPLS